jgi:hypothetical protein
MGVYSEARVEVEFEGSTPEGLTNFGPELQKFVAQKEENAFSLSVYNIKWYEEGGLFFKINSHRLPHMKWQMDQVIAFFQQYPVKPESISFDVMQQSDLTTFVEFEDLEQ